VKVGFFSRGLVPFVGRRRDCRDASVDPLFLSDIRLDGLVLWLIDDGIDWGATGFIISFSRNKWEGLWCCVTSLDCLFCQEYCGMVIMGGEIVVLV